MRKNKVNWWEELIIFSPSGNFLKEICDNSQSMVCIDNLTYENIKNDNEELLRRSTSVKTLLKENNGSPYGKISTEAIRKIGTTLASYNFGSGTSYSCSNLDSGIQAQYDPNNQNIIISDNYIIQCITNDNGADLLGTLVHEQNHKNLMTNSSFMNELESLKPFPDALPLNSEEKRYVLDYLAYESETRSIYYNKASRTYTSNLNTLRREYETKMKILESRIGKSFTDFLDKYNK